MIEKAWVVDLMRDYSIEVAPHDRLDVGQLAEILGPGRAVYITSIPGAPYDRNVAVAAQLRRAGFEPIPHLAARRLPDTAALENFLSRARGEAGVEDVLVIAGDLDRPLGNYESSLAVIESGLLERFGIRRVGIAGYPGGHPKIGAEALRAALMRKCAAAAARGLTARIVTQFCFEPGRILDWEDQRASWNADVPVHIGLAGLASAQTLLKFAHRCGVGASLRMLRTQGRQLVNLLSVSAPDRAVAALAARKAGGSGAFPARLHFFPFGGVARTVAWAEAILRGDFSIDADGEGLDLRVGRSGREPS